MTDQERRGRYLGWAGVVVAIVAALITLPPFEVRTVLPSAVLVAASLAMGLAAVRSGVKRVGWGAVVASVVCLVLAILATRARTSARSRSSSPGARCSPRRCASRRRCSSPVWAASCPSAPGS